MNREREKRRLVEELPIGLCDLISKEVEEFAKESGNQGLQVLSNFQDGYMWYIFKNSSENNYWSLRTRIQVAAFKGEKNFQPNLVFIPDKRLDTSHHGGFSVPAEVRRQGISTLSLAEYDPENPKPFLSSVRANLTQTWEKAQAIPKGQVNMVNIWTR